MWSGGDELGWVGFCLVGLLGLVGWAELVGLVELSWSVDWLLVARHEAMLGWRSVAYGCLVILSGWLLVLVLLPLSLLLVSCGCVVAGDAAGPHQPFSPRGRRQTALWAF